MVKSLVVQATDFGVRRLVAALLFPQGILAISAGNSEHFNSTSYEVGRSITWLICDQASPIKTDPLTKLWKMIRMFSLRYGASMLVTDGQSGTDHFWNAIVENGVEESQFGWCKDKWCVNWQITPTALTKAFSGTDRAAAKCAFDAMMTMKKIDVAAIETAVKG